MQPKISMYPNGSCPNCGGKLFGDGYRTVLRCENTKTDTFDMEPDAMPVYCELLKEDDEND